MAFIQPCFIRKNTPELRKKLEELGYTHIGISLSCIKTNKSGISEQAEECEINTRIDCGTNEELFLALASLRNDNDKNQWFVNSKNDWYKCLDNKFIKETVDWVLCASAETWHKATLKEIVEHFKDK